MIIQELSLFVTVDLISLNNNFWTSQLISWWWCLFMVRQSRNHDCRILAFSLYRFFKSSILRTKASTFVSAWMVVCEISLFDEEEGQDSSWTQLTSSSLNKAPSFKRSFLLSRETLLVELVSLKEKVLSLPCSSIDREDGPCRSTRLVPGRARSCPSAALIHSPFVSNCFSVGVP